MGSDADDKTRALTPAGRQMDAVDQLRARYEALQSRDLAVVRGLNRFGDLPTKIEDPTEAQLTLLLAGSDEDIKKAGWTSRKEVRLAYYGGLPRRAWPAAAQAAHERVGMRIRKQATERPANVFNLQILNMPAQKPPDPTRVVVIDVDDEKPEF